MKGPITNKTLGKPAGAWSDSSFADVRGKLGLAPEEPRHKGNRKHKSRPEKPLWSDYDVGERLWCRVRERDGYTWDCVARVVDAYPMHSGSTFTWADGGSVYVVVEEVAPGSKREEWLGHVRPLWLQPPASYSWVSGVMDMRRPLSERGW